MLERNWYNNEVIPSTTLAPVNSASTTDHNCTGVDGRGFESVVHEVVLGATGDTLSGSVKIELELQHSDTDSSYAACADADLQNPDTGAAGAVTGTNLGTFAVIDANAEANLRYAVRYVGTKRWTRVVVNKTGTHTVGTPLMAQCFRARPTVLPGA